MTQGFLQRYQKWIWWIIAIPILATFSVTGSMSSTCRGTGKSSTMASFTLASGKKVDIDVELYRNFGAALRSLPGDLRFLVSGEPEIKRETIFRFIMLYYAAEEAGVIAPASQVAQVIRILYRDKNNFDEAVQARDIGGNRKVLENYIRRGLVVWNFEQQCARAMDLPDGDEILKQWQEDNEEYKLEYVRFSAEERKKTLDSKSVSEEELAKYFDGLSDGEKNRKYRRELKAAFEGLTLRLDSADDSKFEKLLEGQDIPESDQRLYYNQNKFQRFKRPDEEKKQETKEGEEKAAPKSPFYEFEEVKDKVLRELKLKRALEKLLTQLKEESAKEGFSWEKFGEPYGLEYFSVNEPKSRSELSALERFGAPLFANQIFTPSEGSFSDIVGLAANDFFLYKVTKKIPEGIYALSEVREKALDDYLDKKAMDAVKEDAKNFIAEATPKEPAKEAKEDKSAAKEDFFAKAVSSKDLKLESVDYFSKSHRYKMEYYQEPAGPEKFLKGYMQLLALKAGEVSEAIEDPANKSVYVARVVERRLPEKEKIRPKDFEQAKASARMQGRRAMMGAFSDSESPLSYARLKEFFHLQVFENAGEE